MHGFFKEMIDNNKLNSLVCVVHGCGAQASVEWTQFMLRENKSDVAKHKRLISNLKVAQNRDKYMHCGNPECDEIIDLKMSQN
jgi:hypothetical protein